MQSKNLAARAGRWSAAHRKTAIWGWLAFVVVAVWLTASGTVTQKTLTDLDAGNGDSGQAERILDQAGMRPTQEVVLIQSKQHTADEAGFRALVAKTAAEVSSAKHVKNVTSPIEGDGGAVSKDGHSALIDFEIAGTETNVATHVQPSLDKVAAIEKQNPGYRVEQFGGASAEKEVNAVVQGDLGKAGMLSLPVTMLILLIVFGSLVAAGVPLLVAVTAVMATMSLVAIPSQLFALDQDVSEVILLVGLAVGVDYSLFYTRREREERAKGRTPADALQTAASTSGRAVLISGITVISAMAGMLLTGDKTFISFAIGTITVVAVAMFASLTVLPAMLAWLGDRIEKGRIPFTKRTRRPAAESRMWSAIVTRVMKRPIVSMVLAGGLLLAIAYPALSMNTVATGSDDLSRDIPIVKTYDRVQKAFPGENVKTDVVVEADDVHGGAVGASIAELVRKADASDKLLPGATVSYSKDGTVADVAIPNPGTGEDAASKTALGEVRNNLVPATVGQVDGAEANVTGAAAQSADFNSQLGSSLPLVFAFVLGLAFLLMLVTFRSIVIPIKAIVLNMLSVGAAYGVLVMVFQNGWGESLLGFHSNGGVTAWLPLFLFVILFGLSMDYHVFILTRVKELYDGGASNEEAVRRGIAGTAGTVTSAAAVMVFVFGVFGTLSFIDFKEMGVGLAVAILIDATLIRGVLLPATMQVLGDWNWYLPRFMSNWPVLRRRPQRQPVAAPAPARA